MAVLKGIAAHYVMRADDRVSIMERQRTLLAELVEVLPRPGPDAPRAGVRRRLARRADDAARRRVVIDQVASLTDASAEAWHARLVGSEASVGAAVLGQVLQGPRHPRGLAVLVGPVRPRHLRRGRADAAAAPHS